ncbi:MAG: hypothetical protein JXA36_04440 [Coriobacteriia bacterium]|nr:hypothetical protein [Coriobacteriia bacterium]
MDYDTRYGIALDNWANEGHGAMMLLDMDSGQNAVVLDEPVGMPDGFIIITVRCSNTWVAWEELRGNEQMDPLGVEWKLWVAPIIQGPDVATGAPVLVAESVTSIRSRPLIQVVGDSVYWMTNSYPNPAQEGAVYRSRINTMDLLTGDKREVFTSDRMVHTYCVQEDELIVSMFVDPEGWDMVVEVVSLSDGGKRFEALLGNEDQVSHWVAYRDESLMWGVLYSPRASYPRLLMRTADGEEYVLDESAADPTLVGSRVVYESFTMGTPANLGWPAIHVLDPETGEHFLLVQTSGSMTDIVWQMMPGEPQQEEVLVVTGSIFGDESEEKTGSWVRRYRL